MLSPPGGVWCLDVRNGRISISLFFAAAVQLQSASVTVECLGKPHPFAQRVNTAEGFPTFSEFSSVEDCLGRIRAAHSSQVGARDHNEKLKWSEWAEWAVGFVGCCFQTRAQLVESGMLGSAQGVVFWPSLEAARSGRATSGLGRRCSIVMRHFEREREIYAALRLNRLAGNELCK